MKPSAKADELPAVMSTDDSCSAYLYAAWFLSELVPYHERRFAQEMLRRISSGSPSYEAWRKEWLSGRDKMLSEYHKEITSEIREVIS